MTENEVTYAGFWRRFAAFSLDQVLLVFATSPLYYQLVNQIQAGTREYRSAQTVAAGIFGVISIFVAWSYYAGMESSPLRATLGKLAVGIQVTSDDGRRLSFAKATGRYFGKIISGLIIGIGYLMAGWTTKKQALHDMMAGALVVEREK